MCAIAGEIKLNCDGTVNLDAVGPMVSVLHHRGPDDWGYFVDDRRQVMLLNARLAIVDVEAGRQPLSNEDGSIWVTLNGEIYGFRRLAQMLEARGHRFRTRSDTEVVVHLYEEYGERFVDHLRGEFALALFDGRRDVCYLARDRFGIKPLFYVAAGGSLIFASEMKGLFAHPLVTPALDREQVYHMLGCVLMPSATLFEGVKQVEPGCLIEVKGSALRTVRYWDLSFGHLSGEGSTVRDDDERAYLEEFRRLFHESVRLRLHGDVDVGVYLSGGVDSAAVAHSMRATGRTFKAFTVGFDHPVYDETGPATDIARDQALEHHVVRVARGSLAPHFVRSIWHGEAPVVNAHSTAKFLLSRLANGHVKAVLTGEGADELLAGYAQFRHQWLLDSLRTRPHDRPLRALLAAFLRCHRLASGVVPVRDSPDYDRITTLFGAHPYLALKTRFYQRKLRPLLAADFRRAMRHVDSLEVLASRLDHSALSGLSAVPASQYVLFKTELPGYILSSLGDRQEMAHSVEGRVPFLDHELVEFACGLPLNLKLRPDADKYILRQSFAADLPQASRERKRLFFAPSSTSLGLDRRVSPLDMYLDRRLVDDAGIFNPTALQAIRAGARLLPAGSSVQSVCEAVTVLALSFHVMYDLFCRDFAGARRAYAWTDAADVPQASAIGAQAIGAGARHARDLRHVRRPPH